MAKKARRGRAENEVREGARRGPTWLRGVREQSGFAYWLGLGLVLWLFLIILYPGPLLQGKVFLSSDSSNADAFAAVGDASLEAGHYPLWNPYLFAGMPSFGSLAYVKYVYPPAQVFNFLQQKLHFVPLTWLAVHLLFGGMGIMWLLSRWRLPPAALLLGAVVFLFFPKVVAWGVHGHGSKLGAAMYLPWLLGWALRIQDDIRWSRRWQAVGALGLLMGLQFLRGHVQITYYSLATVAWFALGNAIFPFSASTRRLGWSARWGNLGLVLSGLALGALIGAILLVPVHDYAAISIRGQDTGGGGGVGLAYATGWSLAPAELGTLVLPAIVGFGKATYMGLMPFNDYPNYLGFPLLLFALAAWRRENRALLITALVFAALVVVASFGQGFYAFLYDYLPFFNKFRVPSMILILVAFCVALLAPRGVADWQAGHAAMGRPLVLPMLLGAIGLVCLIAGGSGAGESSFVSRLTALAAKGGKQAAPVLLTEAWQLHKASLVRIGLLCLAGGGALWYSLQNESFRRHGVAWVLLGLVMVDLAAVDRAIIHPEKMLQSVVSDGRGGGRLAPATRLVRDFVPRAEAEPGPGAAVIAAAVGDERIWPLGTYGGQNLWLADGIRSLGGYHPAKLARYEQIRKRLYSDRPAGRLANWLGAGLVVFDRAFAAEQLAALGSLGLDLEPTPVGAGPPFVYRNRAALPRARLVTNWRPVSSLPAGGDLEPFLDGIASGAVSVAGTVYLPAQPDPQPRAYDGVLARPAYVADKTDEVILRTESPTPAVLVLADMMAPGWRVTVDGTEAELLTADLVLRGVALPAGEHTIRFFYVDPAVRQGLTLTVIGLILVLLLLAGPVVRNRWRPEARMSTTGAEKPNV